MFYFAQYLASIAILYIVLGVPLDFSVIWCAIGTVISYLIFGE